MPLLDAPPNCVLIELELVGVDVEVAVPALVNVDMFWSGSSS